MSFLIRLSLLSSLITPALIVASCSHLSRNEDLLTAKQETQLLAFTKAKELESSDLTGSCSLYTRLSEENFPLKEVAQLRAHLICPESDQLPAISEEIVQKHPWLSNLSLQVREKEALQAKDNRRLMEVYFQKAQNSSNIKEKVSLVQLAIKTSEPVFSERPLLEADQKIADELQERLLQLAPRFIENPSEKEYFKVANDWIFVRQFSKGRDYLQKILKNPDFSKEEKYLAARGIRNSFKTEQAKQKHIEESERFTQWLEKNTPQAYQRINEAALIWARAEWTQGNVSKAQKILSTFEKKLKGKWSLEELYYIRARMSEEGKDYDEALSWLEKGLTEGKGPQSPFRSRLLFSQAWLQRKKLNYKEAANAFEKLKSETTDVFDKNRYSFWLGKSWAQAGEKEKSETEFNSLITEDPIGYYGMVAYHELKKEFPRLSNKQSLGTSHLRQPSEISRDEFELIRALSFVKENEILEKLLDQKTLHIKNNSSYVSQNLWLYYLKAYARAGLYNPLFQKFSGLDPALKTAFIGEHPDLLFPRDFLNLIEPAAQKFSIKPELMLSIIRQESAFNPEARSQVDALGLMQVMPDVAKAHKKWTQIEIADYHDLFLPEKNIPIGASVLAQLERKYKGQFVLMVAAYNANDKAIQTWLKTRMQDDPLEFIEDIPYEETKSYIKLVLRNFIFYSRMSQPSQTMPFPNWCLEGLQSFKVSTN